MTRPELLEEWLLGPPGWSMVVCESDLRVGGSFRHVWRRPDATEMEMYGVYRDVVAPERIVRTETFSIGPDSQLGEQVGTLELTERNDSTTLTLTVEFPLREARDAALAAGMEQGVAASYDRLAEFLASTATHRD